MIGKTAHLTKSKPFIVTNFSWTFADCYSFFRFIYFLFLALDTCFRLKRLLVSSEKKDPGLGTGLAYFVEDLPYRKYLLTITDQKEISTCTGFAALDHANNNCGSGYATSGAGMCCCARHKLIEKAGDLQKGER